MAVEELRALPLFDGLSVEQLAELLDAGTVVQVRDGVELFHEGDFADDWWVLLEGSIELLRHVGREDVVVATMVPGRWAGGFRAWDERGVYLATGRGAGPGRVLRVPAEALRERAGAWFPFAQHLLRGLYVTARSIESTARQRESLVALGALAARLAHGINNPAAAATRAVGELTTVTADLGSTVGRMLAGGVTPEQFAALEALRQDLRPTPLGALAASDAEDELVDWLDDHGVDEGWVLAPALVAAGAGRAWCERVADALPPAVLAAGLEWVASTVSAGSLLADARESTQRISHLVAALRSYSQMDRASRQRVDVTEGIENTLTMLGNQIGDGITVVREHAPGVPQLDVYAGELNQVWTCLVDNALDAMQGKGILRISTRTEGDDVVAEIGDDGPGMPPHVAARAFEAFFTTKEAGEGAGLGLDIARRIVEERHGGTITINSSQPGGTVLRVRLPIAKG